MKLKPGDIVEISVNYRNELDTEKYEYVSIGTIEEVNPEEYLCYLIKEVNLWFAEDELELI